MRLQLGCIDRPFGSSLLKHRCALKTSKEILVFSVALLLLWLSACAAPKPAPTPTPTPTAAPTVASPNLDAQTQALIAQAQRVAFVVPFSHWDTDWHDSYPNYAALSDGNILAAIRLAQADPRYRYTFEQVLFVQHFWDTHPEARAGLKALVQRRQLTFAWAGITQPETSLVAPAVQLRNLQLGQDWIASTFGAAYVPHSAWQSDAFGNSAAFPRFLNQSGIPYLFIGRWQNRCDPDYQKCTPLPEAFYWHSPAAPNDPPTLVAYMSYPNAWDAIHRLGTPQEQLTALRAVVEKEFTRTTSKYVFLPMGSDFIDPLPNLPDLVQRWNAADTKTVLVMADPDTAFQYLATQKLPDETVDLNPIWQAFYGTRLQAKIADKESEFFLTAGDKFGLLTGAPQSSAWYTAAISAHYDNIGAVSFDAVWESTQRPRFEQTLATAANDLASRLAHIASAVQGSLVVFNPTSWSRTEVVEIQGNLPDLTPQVPLQDLGPGHIALRADSVPAIGWVAAGAPGDPFSHPAAHAAQAATNGGVVTLSNGLVSVTLDAARGGVFSSLKGPGGNELLSAPGDEVVYWDDNGDVYGSFFGQQHARESGITARLTALASGPLIARAQAVFSLDGQAITKTVTVRADSPLVEVALEIKALPQTSAVLYTPTTIQPQARTDDLGFLPFTHPVDSKPITPGDVTYRREIFYPVTYWSDVSAGGAGLAMITHGLQGVGGMGAFNTLLVRSATDSRGGEGVNDPDYHTLRYAYLPHQGTAAEAQPWLEAYCFNQPLIPVWRAGAEALNIQLPFTGASLMGAVTAWPLTPSARSFPASYSLASAQGGLIADLFQRNQHTVAAILSYEPSAPVSIQIDQKTTAIQAPFPALVPLDLPSQVGN
jgi:hypothetical protein